MRVVVDFKGCLGIFGDIKSNFLSFVRSFEDRQKAQDFAVLINQNIEDLNAFVGLKAFPNPYYPVIIGHYAPLSEVVVVKEPTLLSTNKIVVPMHCADPNAKVTGVGGLLSETILLLALWTV